jgi:hypothetical protein
MASGAFCKTRCTTGGGADADRPKVQPLGFAWTNGDSTRHAYIGSLRIGPLEAATLNPKLCLFGRHTKTPSRPSTVFGPTLRVCGYL